MKDNRIQSTQVTKHIIHLSNDIVAPLTNIDIVVLPSHYSVTKVHKWLDVFNLYVTNGELTLVNSIAYCMATTEQNC